MKLRTFAAETEADLVAFDFYVAVAQSGEAEGRIVAGIFFITDADRGGFEQADDGGDDFLAVQRREFQVAFHVGAYFGESRREVQHFVEFGVVAEEPVVGVIAVLSASAGVGADRL